MIHTDEDDSDSTDIEKAFKEKPEVVQVQEESLDPEYAQVGLQCLAPFTGDDEFYEATIVSIQGGKTVRSTNVVVSYDGYDSSCNETHPLSSIKKLTKQKNELPKQSCSSSRKSYFEKKDAFMRSFYGSSTEEEEMPKVAVKKNVKKKKESTAVNQKTVSTPKQKKQRRIVSSSSSDGEIHNQESDERPQFNFHPPFPKEPFTLNSSGTERQVVQIPATINQYLRDYQRQGAAFMYNHYSSGQGCVLADDMGLGKTIQVISFVSAILGKHGDSRDLFRGQSQQRQKRNGVVLIVSPSSVLYNWLDELQTWGHFKTAKFHGNSKADALERALCLQVDIVLTTYETLRNHLVDLNRVKWLVAVLDEAHRIKEPNAGLTIAAKELNVECRIALTGTPLQNNMSELWCLLDWANPDCLGTLEVFDKRYSIPIKRGQRFDATKRELATARKLQRQLSALLSRMLLRRTKNLIQDQLPQKDERVVFCPMSELQQAIYTTLLSSDDVALILNKEKPCTCGSGMVYSICCFKENSNGESVRALTLKYLNLLLKIANHAALLLPKSNQTEDQRAKAMETCKKLFPDFPELEDMFHSPSLRQMSDPRLCGKMNILETLLDASRRSKDKVLLFSYSTQLLNILENYVISRGFGYSRLDGDTRTDQRSRIVAEFNSTSDVFVCLISTRAGSLGLNFTGANVVVIFDPLWNPSHDLQAQDRAYRIGQRRNVRVYRLISTKSIEENIYLRQVYKQQLSGLALDGNNERRLFNAVQGRKGKTGEIFGIENLFLFSETESVAQKVIGRTECLENGIKTTPYLLKDANTKQEPVDSLVAGTDDDEEVLSQIIDDGDMTTAKDTKAGANLRGSFPSSNSGKKDRKSADASNIEDALDGCGIDFIHSNKSLVGASKHEEHLTTRAIQEVFWDGLNSQDLANQSNADCDDDLEAKDDTKAREIAGEHATTSNRPANEIQRVFERRGNIMYLIGQIPPAIVNQQFNEMSRMNGFETAKEFALHLKSNGIKTATNVLREYYEQEEPGITQVQSFKDIFSSSLPINKRRSLVTRKPAQNRKRKNSSRVVNPFMRTKRSGFIDCKKRFRWGYARKERVCKPALSDQDKSTLSSLQSSEEKKDYSVLSEKTSTSQTEVSNRTIGNVPILTEAQATDVNIPPEKESVLNARPLPYPFDKTSFDALNSNPGEKTSTSIEEPQESPLEFTRIKPTSSTTSKLKRNWSVLDDLFFNDDPSKEADTDSEDCNTKDDAIMDAARSKVNQRKSIIDDLL